MTEAVPRPGRTYHRLAATLLIIGAILGLLNALLALVSGVATPTPGDLTGEGPATVAGQVVDDKSAPVVGAHVLLRETAHQDRTDGLGQFVLSGIPQGTYVLEASAPGHTTTRQPICVSSVNPRGYDILLVLGNGTREVPGCTDRPVPSLGSSIQSNALVLVGLSLAPLLGAIATLLRRPYAIALAGAGIGVLSYGFLLGSLLCLAGMVLLAATGREFSVRTRSGRSYLPPLDGSPTTPLRGSDRFQPADQGEQRPIPTGRSREAKTSPIRGPSTAGPDVLVTQAPGPTGVSRAQHASRARGQPSTASKGTTAGSKETEPVTALATGLADYQVSTEVEAAESELPSPHATVDPVVTDAGHTMGQIDAAIRASAQEMAEGETETDVVSSVLRKLNLDGPAKAPVKPIRAPKGGSHQQRCRHCVKPIDTPVDLVRCTSCAVRVHRWCAKEVLFCPGCGKELPTA